MRPFLLWVAVAAVVVGVYEHRRRAAETVLKYSVTVDGEPPKAGEVEVTLDWREVEPWSRVSLGRRTLRLAGVGLLPLERRLWVWYGVNELGTLEMKRARGHLEIELPEGPRRLSLEGRHLRVRRTDSASVTGDVPEDVYTLTANYPGFGIVTNLTVLRDITNRFDARAELVAVRLTSEPPGAALTLERDDVFTVKLKAAGEHTTPPLPVGAYLLSGTLSDGYETRRTVVLTAGGTNEAVLVFPYGTVELTSVPAGAEVGDAAGSRLGRTPLTLRQVRPGEHRYRVQHPGCDVREALIVVGDGNVVRTELKLVPRGVEAARKLAGNPEGASAEKIEDALNDLEAAVRLRPDDASLGLTATNLMVARALATAREQEAGGRTVAALAAAREALRLRPGLAEVEAMRQRLEARVAEAEAEQRANVIQTRLATARRYAADGRVADSRREVEAALALDAGNAEARALREQLVTRQKPTADEVLRRRREAETGFARGLAGVKDQHLFNTRRWEFPAGKEAVVRALGAVITGQGDGWMAMPRRDAASADIIHLRSGYRAVAATSPCDAFLYVQELEPTLTFVLVKFLLYQAGPNARLVDGEFVEGVVPVHEDYVRQGASEDAARLREKYAAEFHGRLLAGLNAASTP